MKKSTGFIALLLMGVMLLSSCSFSGERPAPNRTPIQALPYPDGAFVQAEKQSVIGSIVQTGDGNAYTRGTVYYPSARSASVAIDKNKHLVTLEHAFGYDCYVSGYIGNSLYIIQDHGSLAWNKKGIGHKDGTVLLEYGEDGYFSISSFSENKIIVGNPMSSDVESLWDFSDSYLFGYMVYDPETREFSPMYEDNNLRFYTAGYFINGVAQVSVKEGDEIRFGIIDEEGNYVVEPTYGMMADERIDGKLIVASEAEGLSTMFYSGDNCGRNIGYDSTLMTNVQKARHYECGSQTVGIIDAKTGETVLPCSYSYVERVMDSTYFVIDNEGGRFLFDADEGSFTEVESGIYSYYNNEWMLYTDDAGETTEENMGNAPAVYLVDKELKLYETTGIEVNDPSYNAKNLINVNAITAELNAKAGHSSNKFLKINEHLSMEYDSDKGTYTVTVKATGAVLYDVNSVVGPFDGGFLYTKENSLYRYDLAKEESEKIDTGYGDFTEYAEWEDATRFYTSIGELAEGVYVLRYNIAIQMGQTYLMVIVNDRGEVLFDAAINSVETLCKNYLGEYDAALYELAGATDIEDNYFLTRDDGAHFLLQFVRGEADDGKGESEDESRYTRTMSNLGDIVYLSPFKLDFTDGSSISVSIRGEELSPEKYVYDSATQTLKLNGSAIDFVTHEKMREDGYAEFVVTAKGESVTLTIKVSEFAFRF